MALCSFHLMQAVGACKSSSYYGDPRSNISANCGGFCTSSTYGKDLYNKHVYYYKINSDYSLTLTRDDSNGKLANDSSITDLKAGNQKASVYVSSDGSTYAYAGSSSGDNTTKGGDVIVGGYGWATGYETTEKTFADSSKNNGNNSYSQYEKPVLTTWITMKVNEIYDGYHFMGWYNSSGTLLESSTTYYYQLAANDANDIQARFLKPEYTSATPKTASTVASGTVLITGFDSKYQTYNRTWVWDDSHGGKNVGKTQIGTTGVYQITNAMINTAYGSTANEITTSQAPNVRLTNGSSTDANTYPSGDEYTINKKTGQSNTSAIYYVENTYEWTNFVHLGATALSVDKTTAAIGEEVTLTATAPSTGTLKSGATYYYYYTTDNSTWYKIAEGSSSNTQKFYPPANGAYTYKVAVQDGKGVETVVATASTTTTVGVVGGKYLAGSKTLLGGANNWDTALDKGLMTDAGSNIYTKTFGNVAAGTYQFRVTTLEADGTVTWETGSSTPAPTGSANPTITDTNNVTFTLSESKQVTITYNDSTKAVTVDVADVQAIDVVVYAGAGGHVEVTYGTAVTVISANENATIKVAYGDSIDLEATPESGYSFSKWYKNLTNDYTGGKEDGYDSLEGEVITQRTVYVASFTAGESDTGFDNSSYTTEGTDFSIKYSTGNSGSTYSGSSGTALGGTVWRSGNNDYYIELSSAELSTWKSTTSGGNQVRWNLFYNTTSQITDKNGYDAQYYDPSTSALKNCENNGDNTLLIKSKPENYSTSIFIELSNIDSSITSLGIHINTSSKKVDYYFGTGAGGGTSAYIPSTNYYAKDSSIREGNYNYWIYPTKTTVTAVDGQISVDHDHTDGHHWVDGFALKGSEITVSTIIPERGRYKSVDKNGNTTTDGPDGLRANEKYYVAGFSFNGVTPELISESSGESVTGVTFADWDDSTSSWTKTWTGAGTKYTCTYKIPANMKESMLEITPIIFVKDKYASETVMVYINGYDETVQNAGWGNTLFMYPFYQYRKDGTSSGAIGEYNGQGENFGRYPGQPVVNYGGQLFCQIPLTDDASTLGKDGNGGPIKGITINNGYYDDVHRTYCNHVSVHRQTYDYDDFAKIYNEKKIKNSKKYLYSIYFSFKYKDKDTSKQHRLNSTTSAIDADGDASRYNDLVASGNILNNTSGTVAATTLETAGTNSGGWEDLQDALGNNVDIFGNKVTDPSADPLRVFSLGYEYNNAGRWATEWAVYHKNGSNYDLIYDDAWGIDSSSGHNNKGYNSSIVPSALIYNDSEDLAAATAMDGDLPISGYDGLYEKLEAYRGVPVKICYEYDIPDAFSPNNYRCDGRWTYTTVDDFVRSNIKIQYYDKHGVLHDDTFGEGTHVGTTTGCSAYFTNSDYYGATQSASEIIDNSKSYTFKAENVGSYEFVGWYMYDTSGLESTITTTKKEADTARSGNFTLAARFRYIASGNLTISNTLAANSVGRATTYLGVTVINGDKETVHANVNSNTGSVTLDKSIINAKSNYQIRIDIRTVPIGENTFKEYTCYTTDGSSGTDVRSAATNTNIYNASRKTNATDSYTVTIKASDIFDSTTTNQQNVKAIEYVSELNPVLYTYSVKFNYTSRQYGDQAFTRTGELTSGQIIDENVVTGTSGQADKKLTKAFLAKIAPHESNFNEKITWDFDNVVDSQTCTYTSGTNTYAISLEIGNNQVTTATDTDFSTERHGYFTVPYSQTGGIANADGSGKVAKTEDTTFTIDLNYDEYFKIGDDFVTAPTVIYEDVEDESTARYFKYWEMSTASSSRGDSRVVGKCYFPEFNYRALDNYNITAVYSTDEDTDMNENSYADLYAAGEFTTIDFIGNSRNQWNNGDNGYHTYYAGDLIYNDFILSFKPQGDDLFKDLSTAECGFIIQRLKEIETNASGANAKTLQEYEKDYTTSDLTAAKAAAAAKAGNSNTTGYTQIKVEVGKANVNDKNRCHYAYAMWNTNQKTSGGAVYPASGSNSNSKYLYRAYSYMKIGNGSYILSEKPAYFYMYDIAQQ